MNDEPERALQDLLEQVDIGVAILDAQGGLVLCNSLARGLIHLLGAGEGMEPLKVLTAFAPDGRELELHERPIHRALFQGVATHAMLIGHEHPHHEGRIWLRSSVVPDMDADGQIQGCTVTFNRVRGADLPGEPDAQQPAEAFGQLEAAETLFEAIVETMTEGVVLVSEQGEILRANPAACETLGLSRDSLEGRYNVDPRFAFRDADGRRLSREQIPSVKVFSSAQPVRDAIVWVHEEPDAVCLSVNGVLLPPLDGYERRAVITFTDITEAERARRELQASQLRYQGIVDSVPGMVFKLATFPQPTFRYLSAGSSQILRRPAEDVPRVADLGRVPAEDVAPILEKLRSGEGTLDAHFRLVDPGLPVTWIHVRARPRIEGDQVLWNGVMLDITESKRLEEQLMQSQRREALGEMVAGIAHNFNNALTAVIPNLEQALDTCTENREGLQDALSAARGAQDLVGQLLFIARRGPELELEATDLSRLVRSTVGVIRTTLPHRIDLEVQIAPGAVVMGKASLLQQVLLNLVLNARDALRGRPAPRLRVRLRESQERWILCVEDNGPGVPQVVLDNLGQPFLTTKPEGEGTGLGLATAVSILSDHGGELRCVSSPEGATFIAELPAHRAPAPKSNPSRGDARAASPGRSILLVDDQALVRRAIRRHLQRWGHTVVEAEGGLEALQIARSTDLDLAILDLSMPEMSGEELLGHLKTRYPSLPIVILTGYQEPDADLSQAQAVLHKPPDMQEMRALIEALTG